MKTPFEPDADFERDPRYTRLIEKIRQLEQQKVSEEFDKRAMEEIKKVKHRPLLIPWMAKQFEEFLLSVRIPRLRLTYSVALSLLAVAIISYYVVSRWPTHPSDMSNVPGVLKTKSLWERQFDSLSNQHVYALTGRVNGKKELFKGIQLTDMKGNILDDREIPSKIIKSNLFQTVIKEKQ